MSHFCHALAASSLEGALSSARVASYQGLLGGGTTEEAIGAYVWSMELSAALAPLVSMVEVVLRNSVHRAAKTKFGKADWYQSVLKNCGDIEWSAKVAANSRLSQQFYRAGVPPYDRRTVVVGGNRKRLAHWRSAAEAKMDDILKRLAKEGKTQAPDQIIAHAMFGFWVDLSGAAFESSTNLYALWPQCLSAVFPFSTSMTRAALEASLRKIKDMRNRLSHHEPVWKLAPTPAPRDVSLVLNSYVQAMRTLLDAMEPSVVTLLTNTGLFGRLTWLLKQDTIGEFAGRNTLRKIDGKAMTREVRKLVISTQRSKNAVPSPRPGKAIELSYASQPLAIFLPQF